MVSHASPNYSAHWQYTGYRRELSTADIRRYVDECSRYVSRPIEAGARRGTRPVYSLHRACVVCGFSKQTCADHSISIVPLALDKLDGAACKLESTASAVRIRWIGGRRLPRPTRKGSNCVRT